MNYRHLFHAGNVGDVVKHNVLIQLLLYLQKKASPYCFIDTHAGIGCYPWSLLATQKTGQAEQGIYRLLAADNKPAILQPYLDLLAGDVYPGSPMIAARLAREQDRIILNEMQQESYLQLKTVMHSYPHVAIHQRNAYELLPAILPPTPARGLILMDPAFEDKNEVVHMKNCLQKCLQRYPQGMYCIWLPIVGRHFYTTRDLGCYEHETLTIEFRVDLPENNPGLIGCSILIINPPWQIDMTLKPLLAYLWEVLHVDPNSTWSIQI